MNLAELTELLAEKNIGYRRDGDELLIDGPDEELTETLIAEIRAHKAALLELAGESVTEQGTDDIPPLRPAAEGSVLPLSFAQRRIWYLDQLESGKATYNLCFAYRVSGPLDAGTLRAALDRIVERHKVLGATFRVADGMPVHEFGARNTCAFEQLRIAEEEKDSLHSKLTSLAMQPFDLEHGPLFRATLLDVGQQHRVLLCVAHHTVFDGASIEILEDELATIYQALADTRTPALEELPVQFGDFAAWQSDWLQGQALERLVQHWLPRVDPRGAPLNFPVDRPYPPEQTYNGGRVFADLPPETVLRLRETASGSRATLFMVMICAYFVALRRFSGEQDLTVGIPVANRTHAHVEKLIGFFANTLPIRFIAEAGQSFSDALRTVRETVIEAIANSELPFERLVEAVNPPRDLARSPIFQALVSFQEGVRRSFSAGDCRFERIRVALPVSRLDLSLFATESGNCLDFVLEYNSDVFEAATAERFLGIVVTVLEAVAQDPGIGIDEIELVRGEERERLLNEFNDSRRDFPAERIERLALGSAVPDDKVAIEFDDRSVSYGELDRGSERIAGALRARGAGPGELVAIYMARSDNMILAMLGVLKAGAGYLPLDPDFPEARLTFMLQDSGAKVVITSRDLADDVPDSPASVALVEDCLEYAVDTTPPDIPEKRPDDVAYVIYTSGSTGQPKGVMVPQRCVSNFLLSMAERPGIGPDDVFLSVTTASFDISVLEFFLPLTVGAKIVIANSDDVADGARLRQLLDERAITMMQATPSAWRMLIDSGWQGDGRLKALCGGEPLHQDLARELVTRTGELWNMFGPTETTIWSTCTKIDDGAAAVHIGTPIANTRIYVLDERQRLVPIGVSGEIWIGGAGVTDGYHDRPELTASNFVPEPYGGEPQARMYRTGDLGRWRPDGSLQHLGRLGSQVKIRGYRIELGEIESVLNEHDDVTAAACRVWEDRPGDQRLVAYLVPVPGREFRATDMRKFLRKKLPDYMIPQHFEQVERIPLTPNGKIDRRSLPPPGGRLRSGRVSAPPETDAERIIAEIWERLIGVEAVGREDFFFDLGGHSLLAVRAASEIEDRLGSRPHLRQFILEDLAEIAARTSAGQQPARDTGGGGLLSRIFGKK